MARPLRCRRAALFLAAVLALSGCGTSAPPFFCPREALRASLRTDVLAGNFESRRDENSELDAVEGAIEGRILGRGISMWVSRGLDRPLSVSASVGVRLETTAATAAQGEIRVAAIDPLRLELDFVATIGGRELPVRGPLEVRHETFNQSCFE